MWLRFTPIWLEPAPYDFHLEAAVTLCEWNHPRRDTQTHRSVVLVGPTPDEALANARERWLCRDIEKARVRVNGLGALSPIEHARPTARGKTHPKIPAARL